MNDERLIQAAKGAVSIIIRRPHAYEFKRDYRKAQIPGITVLNADGEFVGAVRVPSSQAVEKLVELLKTKKRAF